MASWQGSVIATINQYIKGRTDAVERNSVVLAMLKDKNRLTTGAKNSGETVVWNVLYKLPSTTVYEDMAVRQFPRPNLLKQASLPWGSYDTSTAISKHDLLKNRGAEKMTDLLQTMIDASMESMVQTFCRDLYVDGTGTRKVHGFGSWFGTGATLSNGVFNPSDTYAGLSTALGNYGGTATSATWPNGNTTTPEYDFWSPLIVSSTSTAFGTDATWAANAVNILRKAKTWSDRNSRMDGRATTFITDPAYYSDLLAQLELKERVVASDATTKLAKLGFQTVNYQGLECTHEYFCPASQGFGICWDVLELKSQQEDLFESAEKVFSETDKSWRMGVDFYGQLVSKSIRPHFNVQELGS